MYHLHTWPHPNVFKIPQPLACGKHIFALKCLVDFEELLMNAYCAAGMFAVCSWMPTVSQVILQNYEFIHFGFVGKAKGILLEKETRKKKDQMKHYRNQNKTKKVPLYQMHWIDLN